MLRRKRAKAAVGDVEGAAAAEPAIRHSRRRGTPSNGSNNNHGRERETAERETGVPFGRAEEMVRTLACLLPEAFSNTQRSVVCRALETQTGIRVDIGGRDTALFRAYG